MTVWTYEEECLGNGRGGIPGWRRGVGNAGGSVVAAWEMAGMSAIVVCNNNVEMEGKMSNWLVPMGRQFEWLAGALAVMEGVPATAMWPAVLDTRTERYPEGDHAPQRVYRLIGAPRGSTLYWDQPLVVAAHWYSLYSGEAGPAAAAERYTREFLDRCVDEKGLFQWGNHIYYDVFGARAVGFHGGVHELRPITPAWELFWRLEPEVTARYIRVMGDRHVYDRASGGFNRHDDQLKSHAFLEAGGILAESLAWLHGKTGEGDALELARRIAGYSYGHRGESTGLVRNEPDHGRWDSKVCTTEIGVWAQSLLRAATWSGEDAFARMAEEAVRAYLVHGYDEKSGRYAGQVGVEDGRHVVPETSGYWPGRHADPWTTEQWPTHDYPMAVAEACISLHERTGEALFEEAIGRWARIAVESSPARTGRWAYAESYGRCIHFLTRASRHLGDPGLRVAAEAMAEEAVASLLDNGHFQGYAGSHVYESVDGVGYLFLALLGLETGEEGELFGFGF